MLIYFRISFVGIVYAYLLAHLSYKYLSNVQHNSDQVDYMKKIEQKGIVFFYHDFCYSLSPFLFPPNKRGKKKRRINNQRRGKKNNAFLLDL